MTRAPNDRRIAGHRRGEAARDRAEQDGEEGRAFDERVAGGQLLAREMVGQDAVFDRAEQRRDDAEQRQRHEQHRHGIEQKPTTDRAGREDLGELQPPRHHRLVVAVGHLAAETRRAGRTAG